MWVCFHWGIVEHDIRLTGEHFKKSGKRPKLYGEIEDKVCLLKLHPGLDPKIIDNILDMGYEGLILEGFGAGNVPIKGNSFLPSIKKAIHNNVPVVVSTQCAIGCSWMYLYECGKRALDIGAIPGYDMISETALVKLMWVLAQTNNMKKIKKMMLSDIGGEISDIRFPKEKRIWEYSL